MIALLGTLAVVWLVVAALLFGCLLLDEDMPPARRLALAAGWPVTLLAALVVRPWRRERPEDS